MVTTHNIRAVIWDLGGVILRTEDLSYREKWEKRLGLQPWGLASLIFGSEMSKLASVGQAQANDVWGAVQKELALEEQDLAQLKGDFFAGDQIDEELMTFIRRIKDKYKSGMITNAWSDTRHWIIHEWKIGDAFDHILVSAEIGIVKPDAEIYSLSLEALDVQPDEAIFIDDFVENVEGAESVGMQTIHFQEPDEVMKQLKELLTI